MKFDVRIPKRRKLETQIEFDIYWKWFDSNLRKDDIWEPPFLIDRLFVIFYSPRLRDVKDEGKIKERKNEKTRENFVTLSSTVTVLTEAIGGKG